MSSWRTSGAGVTGVPAQAGASLSFPLRVRAGLGRDAAVKVLQEAGTLAVIPSLLGAALALPGEETPAPGLLNITHRATVAHDRRGRTSF
jgi:hypothetical protein